MSASIQDCGLPQDSSLDSLAISDLKFLVIDFSAVSLLLMSLCSQHCHHWDLGWRSQEHHFLTTILSAAAYRCFSLL